MIIGSYLWIHLITFNCSASGLAFFDFALGANERL